MINGLPEKIKDLRQKYKYSQKQVADKIGVSSSVVSGYETGERTPSVEVLLALSYLFNCSTDYLLGKSKGAEPIKVDCSTLNEEQTIALNQFLKTLRQKADKL